MKRLLFLYPSNRELFYTQLISLLEKNKDFIAEGYSLDSKTEILPTFSSGIESPNNILCQSTSEDVLEGYMLQAEVIDADFTQVKIDSNESSSKQVLMLNPSNIQESLRRVKDICA